MPSSKRDHARIERRLIAALTHACETAKAEIIGFDWLTHEVDYQAVAQSLCVVWVFDTQANKDQALAAGQDKRMIELTSLALSDAEVTIKHVQRHVRFDSEEACMASHAGDWVKRLAKLHRP
jgi:hypothetical protein